jgi:hypothetical protein
MSTASDALASSVMTCPETVICGVVGALES